MQVLDPMIDEEIFQHFENFKISAARKLQRKTKMQVKCLIKVYFLSILTKQQEILRVGLY